ncbi:MAG: dockerin type I domain-containing protein, partial [Planctomycetota bacterium]
FWQMTNDNSISTSGDDYAFFREGDTYIVYLRNGGGTSLDLSNASGLYEVRWYNPRSGGDLQTGTRAYVAGGAVVSIGLPPEDSELDWTALVRRVPDNGQNNPPLVSITGVEPLEFVEGDVFQEQNGLIVVELESMPPVDGWELQTSIPGFTGDGYFRWEGPNLFGQPGAQGVIQYKINVTNPGLYQMRFRNHRDGDIKFDQENDIWARLDNQQWIKIFSSQQGFWNWASNFDFGEGNRPSASYDLSAGEHTFTISGRSQGFRVDRFVFYNTALTSAGSAQNTSNPQSPTGGVANGLGFAVVGDVVDDGQILLSPNLQWSILSGPGTAEFSDVNSESTNVFFSDPGTYEIQLCADDGEFEVCDSIMIVTDEKTMEDLTFTPIDDAYVEGSTGINNNVIKAQLSGPSRVGYLKFDVTGVAGAEVESAELKMTVSQDPGNGILNLFEGQTTSWTEGSINSGNAPGNGPLLDTMNGNYALNQEVSFDVLSAIQGDGEYTFVLRHGGGNDVWFSSKEGGAAPELQLTLSTVLLGDVNCDGVVDLLDIQPFVDLLSVGGYSNKADFNEDGEVTLLDVEPFIDALQGP